jgi:predicted ArsR family transcriptional regulator
VNTTLLESVSATLAHIERDNDEGYYAAAYKRDVKQLKEALEWQCAVTHAALESQERLCSQLHAIAVIVAPYDPVACNDIVCDHVQCVGGRVQVALGGAPL